MYSVFFFPPPDTQEEDYVFSMWCVTFPPAVVGVACALMGESKLFLPVCHCQWTDWVNHSCQCWRGALHHTCAHSLFSLRIGVFFFSSQTEEIAHFIIPSLLLWTTLTSKFSSIALCSLREHTSDWLSLLFSISSKHDSYWDSPVKPACFIFCLSPTSVLQSSINTSVMVKTFPAIKGPSCAIPLSSCIHFCSRHAQMLFVPLFIGMYLTVRLCCVCEQSCLCSSRRLTLVYRAKGGKVCIIKLS